ncbi:putative secreted effector protein [Blumeria graminis f. sp. tritici 96224]|nr:putative secreted effector protein [Blumeria graminis f. sp. tritici 96224]
MRITINLSPAKLRDWHAFLFAFVTLLELSLQSDVSGYICGDLVVWHDRVVEVAQLASKMLKSSTVRQKFPALLEDTQLFGIESQNLFVVPLRRFGFPRSIGKYGQDRVVLDASGKFMGVIYDTNDGNVNPMPAYRKCSPFIDYNHPELEEYIDDGYQLAGFACGSNFLERDIETNLHNECVEYLNSPPEIKIKYKFSRRRPIRYQFEFNSQCRFLQLRPISFKTPEQMTCVDVWSAVLPAATIMADPSFDLQSKNFGNSEELYSCMYFTFRITSILNYISNFLRTLSTDSSSIEHQTFKQDDNLLLWRIILPERHERSRLPLQLP